MIPAMTFELPWEIKPKAVSAIDISMQDNYIIHNYSYEQPQNAFLIQGFPAPASSTHKCTE